MTRYGYFLSCEEYDPASLVRQAVLAEQAGFEALWISDHFHPWLDEQGQSSFVWSMIGAISQVTSLPIGTAVTCPTTRMHPVVVAHAAATAGGLTGGRVTPRGGTGEALNEHVTGEKWPAAAERRDMLEEASTIIAELFTGEQITYRGTYYQVETARLYTRPDTPPPVYVSGFGEKTARLAARGGDHPVQGGVKACWAPDAAEARATMRRLWPTDFIPGESAQLLPLPRHFRQLAPLVTDEMVAAPCGPDPEPYVRAVRAYEQAGFDEVYLGQAGGRLDGAFEFYATQVL